VILTNNIIARNPRGGNCSASAGHPITGDYNLSDRPAQTSACGWNARNNIIVETANLGIDTAPAVSGLIAPSAVIPFLSEGALKDNGGVTRTIALISAAGPAINAGDASKCPSTDQRGYVRSGCDLGAVLFQTDRCLNNLVSLVAAEPNLVMTRDMLVTTTNDLRVLSGPAINAAKDGALAWNSTDITVTERLLFGTAPSNQIWYRIQKGDLSGWIIAQFNSVDYVLGGDVCTANNLPAPTQLTFRYDRKAAVSYAIAHAYQNDTLTNNELNGQQRVIKRLATIINIPYAYFTYPELGSANELGKSGSAYFTSQSIWSGGMPMIVGQIDENDVCKSGIENGGWRYCLGIQNGRHSSYAWAIHKGIIVHFTNGSVIYPPSLSKSDAIQANSKGTQITSSNRTSGFQERDISQYVYLASGVPKQKVNAAEISAWAKKNLGELRAGDYAWLSSYQRVGDTLTQGDAHGLLIAGWAIAMPCYDARFGGIFDFQNPQLQNDSEMENPRQKDDYLLYISVNNAIDKHIVPYVVDYAGPKGNRIQRPIARPFYCTKSADVKSNGNFDGTQSPGYFYNGNPPSEWYFYRFNDEIRIDLINGLSYQYLYTPERWLWTESDGN
jgi:hypothetical protein